MSAENENEMDDKKTYLQIKEEIGILTSMMQRIINLSDYKGKDKMIKQYSDKINDKIYQYQKLHKKNEIHKQETAAEEQAHFG
jgi:hypothetical protein